jgi:hypothetical protein
MQTKVLYLYLHNDQEAKFVDSCGSVRTRVGTWLVSGVSMTSSSWVGDTL